MKHGLDSSKKMTRAIVEVTRKLEEAHECQFWAGLLKGDNGSRWSWVLALVPQEVVHRWGGCWLPAWKQKSRRRKPHPLYKRWETSGLLVSHWPPWTRRASSDLKLSQLSSAIQISAQHIPVIADIPVTYGQKIFMPFFSVVFKKCTSFSRYLSDGSF